MFHVAATFDGATTRSRAIARPRIAIIDDYQRVSLGFADWGRLDADVHLVCHRRGVGHGSSCLQPGYR